MKDRDTLSSKYKADTANTGYILRHEEKATRIKTRKKA